MDLELLMDIFHISAPSLEEKKMSYFIQDFLNKNKIKYTEDSYGNIFSIDKIGKPLLAAHMDTVQGTRDVILSDFIRLKNDIISGIGVIGADDKNGIFIILELLKEMEDNFNFAFFVEEEIGLNGSSFFVKKHGKYLEKNILYGIVLDRKGSSDILCTSNNYGTFEFEIELETVGDDFGYISNVGILSDADNLSDYISCTNLSVGYYNAHTKYEYTIVSEIENTLNYVREILLNITSKFNKPSKTRYSYLNDDLVMFADVCDICGKEKDNTFFIAEYNKSICEDCAGMITELYYSGETKNYDRSYDGFIEEEYYDKHLGGYFD